MSSSHLTSTIIHFGVHVWHFAPLRFNTSFFFTLVCFVKPCEKGIPSFSFPSFMLLSFLTSLATAKYLLLRSVSLFLHIVMNRDSHRLLCSINMLSFAVIYKLYIYIWPFWCIAMPQLCTPDWHPPLFVSSVTAKEQYVIPGEWLVNVHTFHSHVLFVVINCSHVVDIIVFMADCSFSFQSWTFWTSQ